MNRIELETFTPATLPGAPVTVLGEAELEELRRQAYREGVEAGAKATSEAFDTAQATTLAAIAETLNDAMLTREETAGQIIHSLRALVEGLVATLLPELAAQGFGEELAARLETLLRAADIPPPKVTLAPGTMADIAALFETRAIRAELASDPDLPAQAARIHWPEGFAALDLNATLAELQTLTDDFFARTHQSPSKESLHAS